MTTPYMECPHCGKRALSVATRCPHCDADFPPRPLQRQAQGTPFSKKAPGVIAAAVVVAAALAAGIYVSRSPKTAKPVGATTEGRDSVAAGAPEARSDSAGAVAPRQPGTTRKSAGAPAPVPAPAPQPVISGASDSLAAPRAPQGPGPRTPDAPTGLRYARTWTNVRSEPAQSAPTVGRLDPGQSVQVDSLVRGWYRVVVDGRAFGYVHRSTLAATPP